MLCLIQQHYIFPFRPIEEDARSPQDVEKQREELNKRLGLDVAAKLGVKTEEIFSNEDLATSTPATTSDQAAKKPKTSSSASSSSSGLSARERNKLKRSLSKQKSQQAAAAKRKKHSPKLYKATKEESDGPEWPLEGFASHLLSDLFERRWEARHGAATALKEILRLRGEGAGRLRSSGVDDDGRHRAWVEDAALRLVSVVARDRFGDFVSDEVVAPVREAAAQALGAAAGLLTADGALALARLLMELLAEENWQCRHGGLLGVSNKSSLFIRGA